MADNTSHDGEGCGAGSGRGLLAGKLAFVTGAASGIGRSTCVAMAREGARVVLADLNEAPLQETLAMLVRPHLDQHLCLRVDVADEASVNAAVLAVEQHYGRPADVVVNSAGIMGSVVELLDLDLEEMRRVHAVNVEGTFLVMRACVRALKRAGMGGAIVNLSSAGQITNFPRRSHYSSTKAAVSVLTKTASKEWAPLGVRVNAVLPGLIDTPMSGAAQAATKEMLKKVTALGRMGKPEEVAEVIVFLSSDHSSYMTGVDVPVSGGISPYI